MPRKFPFVLPALLLATAGAAFVAYSHAETSAGSREAESGTRTTNVSVINDTHASGNTAVRFGAGAQPYNPTATSAIPSNLRLTFSDEFSGNSLDLTKWDPNWLAWDATKITPPANPGSEPVCYDPSQTTVKDGLLNLRLEDRACTAANGTTYTHASGMIQSVRYFNYTYGYAEAYINLPAGSDGTTPVDWPAFWADGQSWPADGEDDIMEVLDSKTCFSYHSSAGDAGPTCPHMSAGWHHFASYWQPTSVTYFYDGIDVGTYAVSVSSPHYLILNLSMANWATANMTPATLQADYVRVWQ